MARLTAATQTFVRFAAVTLSAWAVSGAVALADGSSEYSALSGDPYEALFDHDHDHDHDDDDYDHHDDDHELTGGGLNNTAVIVQQGNGNRIELTQFGENNLMTSTQIASTDGNRAEIAQTGNDNQGILLQNGDDNEYELSQNGNNNLSSATQHGEDNRFEHLQTGDNLGFVVTQYGESSIRVTQTGY